MNFDNHKVDEAVLAVLYLTLHDNNRAWKTLGWEAMHRLHQKGLISNPASHAKSVAFTDEGLTAAERLAQKMLA